MRQSGTILMARQQQGQYVRVLIAGKGLAIKRILVINYR